MGVGVGIDGEDFTKTAPIFENPWPHAKISVRSLSKGHRCEAGNKPSVSEKNNSITMASTPQQDLRKVSIARTRHAAAAAQTSGSPHTPLSRSVSSLYGSPTANFRL